MPTLTFLNEFDPDLQQTLLNQIRDSWTHTSTALEGNQLSLDDTRFVIEEGLTVAGKSIKDHQEVIGHAKAIDIIYSMLGKPVDQNHLFALHQAVQVDAVVDIYKPQGAWKNEPNGTYAMNGDQRIFLEFSPPSKVPVLMAKFLREVNAYCDKAISEREAPEVFAKLHIALTHIHPFWDGNGRIARLIANMPLLNAGLPPLIIPKASRQYYLQILGAYHIAVGQLTDPPTWPNASALTPFIEFCKQAYQEVFTMISEAHMVQSSRSDYK